MKNELTSELAGEISRLHAAAEQSARDAKCSAEDALAFAVQTGRHIEQVQQMTKGRTLAWLRDNVPDLTPDRAKAYLSLFHVHKEDETKRLDHRQLLLLGVIDKAEAIATDRSEPDLGAGKWIAWASNIKGWWTKETRMRPVSNWSAEERLAVRDQLKPIVEIWEALDHA